MKTTTKLKQSYLLTISNYSFTRMEKLVMYRIIQIAQNNVEKCAINEDLFGNKLISMPVSLITNTDNYKNVYAALRGLANKKVEINTQEEWATFNIINMVSHKKQSGVINFTVHKSFWYSLVDFAKGWRNYNLRDVLELKSVFAMRFYELFYNQKKPIIFTIQNLREMFGAEQKYINNDSAFIKYTIIPAYEELQKLGRGEFEYFILKSGKKMTAIKFLPVAKLDKKTIQQSAKNVSPHLLFPQHVINYLKQTFDFTTKEIQNNVETLLTAGDDLLDICVLNKRNIQRANNPKGYLINILKNIKKA